MKMAREIALRSDGPEEAEAVDDVTAYAKRMRAALPLPEDRAAAWAAHVLTLRARPKRAVLRDPVTGEPKLDDQTGEILWEDVTRYTENELFEACLIVAAELRGDQWPGLKNIIESLRLVRAKGIERQQRAEQNLERKALPTRAPKSRSEIEAERQRAEEAKEELRTLAARLGRMVPRPRMQDREREQPPLRTATAAELAHAEARRAENRRQAEALACQEAPRQEGGE